MVFIAEGNITITTQYSKLCGSCAFPQNFNIRKLGDITVFHVVIMKRKRDWCRSLVE